MTMTMRMTTTLTMHGFGVQAPRTRWMACARWTGSGIEHFFFLFLFFLLSAMVKFFYDDDGS